MSLKQGDKVKVRIPKEDSQCLFDRWGIVQEMLNFDNQICTVDKHTYEGFVTLKEDIKGFHWDTRLLEIAV